MPTSLITIDGVLRKLVGAPIVEGIRLYRSLITTGHVIFLADWAADAQMIEEWLELHGCTGQNFVSWADGLSRADQVNVLRRQGYDIDLVVEPDPAQASELIRAGYNTLLFTHSHYAHPSWRPDAGKGIESWGKIVDATARIAKMKAADERLRSDE